MAKINARGARQVGPTLFTEKVRTFDKGTPNEETRVYYEAWRLRSDGVVQKRIIATRPGSEVGGYPATEHRGSAFRNVARAKHGPVAVDIDFLRRWLAAKGYTIVKERY